MDTALIIAAVSGTLLACVTSLFVYEARIGRRVLYRTRDAIDASMDASIRHARRKLPSLDSGFVRQIFHYLTHVILQRILHLLRTIEALIRKAAHVNRTKAKKVAQTKPQGHLAEVAKHKADAQLSDREKREHKSRALRGE